jgi:hypothetical protein
MRFLKLVFLVVFGLSSASASGDEGQARTLRLLPGKWHAAYTFGPAEFDADVTFRSDGTVTYDGTAVVEGDVFPFLIEGTWVSETDGYTVTITASSSAELSRVGSVEHNTIISLNESTMTYRGDEGHELTIVRQSE